MHDKVSFKVITISTFLVWYDVDVLMISLNQGRSYLEMLEYVNTILICILDNAR